MQIHCNIKITGKVQGVFFRKHTKEKADELFLKGIVKNEKGNSVYIEVEGEEEEVKEFIKWCYKGSPKSIVENVQTEQENVKGYNNFEIVIH